MPRIFPVIVKRTTSTPAAFDSDGTANLGTEGESMAVVTLALSPQSTGTEGESMALGTLNLRAPTGTESESLSALAQTGSALRTLGSEGESAPTWAGRLPISIGTGGESFASSSSITAYEQAGAASRVDLTPTGGDATWSTPANAQAEDGTESVITLTGQPGAAVGFSDELRLETYTPGSTPTGWTLSAVDLSIRQRWTSLRAVIDITSTLSQTIVVRYTDATETTIETRTEASANRAALATDVFALNAAKTVDRIMCKAVCSIALAATTTTFAWNVDVARLRFTYSRSSIT